MRAIMPPSIRPPSTASSRSVPPRRLRRSPPRQRGRLRSRARRVRPAAPRAQGGRSRVASSRGRERRGGVGQSSRCHPSLAEDRLARKLFLHTLAYKVADSLFLFGSEPSEPSEPRIHILFYTRGLLRRVLVFGFTRFTTSTTTRRIRLRFGGFFR